MTKIEIDNYFTSYYPKLRTIISGYIIKYKREYSPEIVVTETYIHLIKNIKIVTSISMLEAVCIQFVKENTRWENCYLLKTNTNISNFLNREKKDKVSGLTETYLMGTNRLDECFQEKANSIIDDYDEVVDQEIENHKYRTNQLDILTAYRKQLTDNVMIVIFDTVFNNKITKCTHLSKYLNINRATSCIYYKRLIADIIDFKNNYNK